MRKLLAIVVSAMALSVMSPPARASHAAPTTTKYFSGIRPGAPVALGDLRTRCTYNFVFRDTATNYRFIGTAGHCVPGRFPDWNGTVWRYGAGTPTFIGCTNDELGQRWGNCGERVGYVVYRSFGYEFLASPLGGFITGPSTDFALIAVEGNQHRADPAVAHFGGPTATYTGHSDLPALLHHYGNGYRPAGSAVIPAPAAEHGRTHLKQGETSCHLDFFAQTGTPYGGDSGSPMIDGEGRAAAVLVAVAPLATISESVEGGGDHVHTGPFRAQRIECEVEWAERRLREAGVIRGELELMKAPF